MVDHSAAVVLLTYPGQWRGAEQRFRIVRDGRLKKGSGFDLEPQSDQVKLFGRICTDHC